jgi:predicted AAA+ superfamily ATPase
MTSQRILPLAEIFGRDDLTATLWQILKEKSVVFTGERRMGKTYGLYKLLGKVIQ